MRIRLLKLAAFLLLACCHAFAPPGHITTRHSTILSALDEQMEARLDGITRSYNALTERLGDPDVIGDAQLLKQVMSDRAQSEEVVMAYEEYKSLKEELEGAKELFQESGDDTELKEMARAEMKEIEPRLEELETKITILLLPKDPNDDRNVMLEIRAGTGGSEANIFAGTYIDSYVRMCSIVSGHSLSLIKPFHVRKATCWMSIESTLVPMDGKQP